MVLSVLHLEQNKTGEKTIYFAFPLSRVFLNTSNFYITFSHQILTRKGLYKTQIDTLSF